MYVLNFNTKYSSRWVNSPQTLDEIAYILPICAGDSYIQEQFDADLLGMLLSFVDEPVITEYPSGLYIPVTSKKGDNIIEEKWMLRVWHKGASTDQADDFNAAVNKRLDAIHIMNSDPVSVSGFGMTHSNARGHSMSPTTLDKRNRVWFDPELGCMFSYNKNFFRRIDQRHPQLRQNLVRKYGKALREAQEKDDIVWYDTAKKFWQSKFNWPARLEAELSSTE